MIPKYLHKYDIANSKGVYRRGRKGNKSFIGYRMGGKAYILCPFHNEKTPSMTIYEDHCHCFGCGRYANNAEMGRILKDKYNIPTRVKIYDYEDQFNFVNDVISLKPQHNKEMLIDDLTDEELDLLF